MSLDIINQGTIDPSFVENNFTSTQCGVSLSETLFSYVLEKYLTCNGCGVRSPSFEHSNFVNITPSYGASMRELIMQGLKLEIFKSCLKCKRDTLHVGSSNFLQPPRYLIITIGRFENKHGILTKNRTLIPLDQQITSGPFNFRLQATIDHHGQFMSSGHYTTSVFCCSKVFYCNDGRVTIYNEDNIRDSHTVYIMIYKLVNHM